MPKIKRLDSWEAAVAVLLVEGRMHIDRLTELVVESGISTLGLRGDTPRQSLCPQLTKRWEIFRWDRGFYDVWTSAKELAEPRIVDAKRRYLEWKQQREKQQAAEQRARDELLRTLINIIPRS